MIVVQDVVSKGLWFACSVDLLRLGRIELCSKTDEKKSKLAFFELMIFVSFFPQKAACDFTGLGIFLGYYLTENEGYYLSKFNARGHRNFN